MSYRENATKGGMKRVEPGYLAQSVVDGLVQNGYFIFHIGPGIPGEGGTLTLEKRAFPATGMSEEGIGREAGELLQGVPLAGQDKAQGAAKTQLWSHQAFDEQGKVKYTRVFFEIIGVEKEFLYEVAGLFDRATDQVEAFYAVDSEFTTRVAEEVERDPEVRELRERLREKRAEVLEIEAEAERLVAKKAAEREGLRKDYRYVVSPREL